MKSSDKEAKGFKFSFSVLIRLAIFFILIAALINYLGSNKTKPQTADPTVLGEETDLSPLINSLYQQLPPNSRDLLKNYASNSNFKYIQGKLNDIKTEANGFPQKQINDLKKEIINSIYRDLMKNIDSST